MALTPSDIEGKTFGTALRGYDLDEVDDFLDDVVGTLRELQDQLATARATPPESVEPPVIADESAVGRALIAAQATGDSIISDAREESERLLNDGREESERILNDARGEAETWVTERDAKKAEADVEMAELTDHVSNVRTQLANLATSVADRLDEMDQAIGGSFESPEGGAAADGDDETPAENEEALAEVLDETEDEVPAEAPAEDDEAFSLDDDSESDEASNDEEDEDGEEASSDDYEDAPSDLDDSSSD